MNPMRLCFVLLMAVALYGCGKKRPKSGGGSASGKLEKAFQVAAKKYDIPVRFLKAVGYLEGARFSPQKASAMYVDSSRPNSGIERGTWLTENAFGIPMKSLELDPNAEQSYTLEAQIEAYAKYVSEYVKGFNLNPNPRDLEDKGFWLESFAEINRRGRAELHIQNVRILFALELINILNDGFVWQDPSTGEILELAKERPPINPDDFSRDLQGWFELNESEAFSDFAPYATRFELASSAAQNGNEPKRIEIIHCPMSASACLEMQNTDGDRDLYVYMEPHIVIPQWYGESSDKDSIFNQALQIADLHKVRRVTNAAGDGSYVDNAVVIMIAGTSGKIIDGERWPAIPTWLSGHQLELLSVLSSEICRHLEEKSGVDAAECMGFSSENGIQFRSRGTSEEFRWGDIADFDRSIFEASINNRLTSQVAFEFPGDKRVFRAGEIKLTLAMDLRHAKEIRLEKLARCKSGHVTWVNISTDGVEGERRKTFEKLINDSGPNRNGDHFFKVKIYDSEGEVIGWAIDQIYVENYSDELRYASESDCRRNDY